MAARTHEDEEEKRRQKNANVAIAAFTQSQKGSGKGKPVCRDYMTDNGCNKGGQCSYQHPPTNGRCLRCGSTKHSVSDCRRPRKDAPANPAAKAKSTGKGPPLPKAKAKQGPKGGGKGKNQGGGGGGGGGGATNQQAQPKGQAKKRAQSQPKSKPKAKASSHQAEAEAGLMEVDWAGGDLYDPPTGALGSEDVPFTGCISIDHFAHACTFYTTFHPPSIPLKVPMPMAFYLLFLTQVRLIAYFHSSGCIPNKQPTPSVYTSKLLPGPLSELYFTTTSYIVRRSRGLYCQ